MSFSEYFQAASGLGDAFADAFQRREAQKLLGQQLDAALAAQGQPAALGGLNGLQQPPQTPLAALGTPTRSLPAFAQAGGDMGGYLDTIRAKESGGNDLAKNPNSSATGRYQFTSGTWNALAKSHPELGLTPSGRTDPAQQERAIRVFTQENAKALSNAGLPINPQNLYGAHFLGAGGANRFIPAAINNPDAPAASFVGRDVAAANRAVFFNRDGTPKTAGQVYAWMGSGGRGGGQQQVARAPVATPVLPQSGGMSMAGMPAPQMPGAPTQVAQADMPAPGAQPIGGFAVPQGQSAEFVPGTEASPALAQGRAPDAGTGLAPAATQRLSPAQADNLRAMLRNPYTAPQAAKIIEGLNKPDEFSFQVVGDQLVRTSKSGRAEVVPNITKPVQFQTFKGSDGNDYVFNPQTGQTTRAIQGRDQGVRDLTAGEKAARGIPAERFAQIDSEGKVSFPGQAATQVNIDNKAESAGRKAFATNSASKVAERFDAIGKVGEEARGSLPLIEEIRALGGAIGTGGLASLQAKLGEYGIKTQGSDKIEAYNALLDRLTPSQRVEGSGATSDFDARMFKGSLPRLINTPEGNALIADTLKAVAEDRIARGEIGNLVLLGEEQGGISPQEGFKRLKALPSVQGAFSAGMKALRENGKLGEVKPEASSASPDPKIPSLGVGGSTVVNGVTIRRIN